MRELQIFQKLLYQEREHYVMPEAKKRKLWKLLVAWMYTREIQKTKETDV